MPKVNQQSIADALNVSKATVSRCFSNHPGISPETRSRVFQKASELGYKPLIPRSKRGRGAKITRIAMVACVPSGKFGNEEYSDPGSAILEGLNEIALINDWLMETHFIDPLTQDVAESLRQLVKSTKAAPWDGLLLVYPFPRDSLVRLVKRLPCVSVMEQYGNRVPLDSVDADSHRGVAAMVDRLVEAGHTRIGFYSEFYPVNPTWTIRRFGAYAERMAFHNLRFHPKDIFGIYPDTQGSERHSIPAVIEQIKDGMTALVCGADHQAYPIINGLKKGGLKVPRDLSITGFDGIPVPKGMPQLNSMRIPHKEVGVAAMQRLGTILQLRSFATRNIQLECSEIPGKTIAPPRKD